MSGKEAEKRPAASHNQADTTCDHVIVVLQHTDNGYLTGQYVCTRCGAIIRGGQEVA